MDDEQAGAIVERAEGAVGQSCFASVTPRQLRLSQGAWFMLGSIWTADNAKAWQVWFRLGTDEGRLWPYVVTKDGVTPRKFKP